MMKILIFLLFCITLSAAFECGVRKISPRLQRVPNGKNSYPGQWPWFVALYENGSDKFLCGATLINQWTLVTSKCLKFIRNFQKKNHFSCKFCQRITTKRYRCPNRSIWLIRWGRKALAEKEHFWDKNSWKFWRLPTTSCWFKYCNFNIWGTFEVHKLHTADLPSNKR